MHSNTDLVDEPNYRSYSMKTYDKSLEVFLQELAIGASKLISSGHSDKQHFGVLLPPVYALVLLPVYVPVYAPGLLLVYALVLLPVYAPVYAPAYPSGYAPVCPPVLFPVYAPAYHSGYASVCPPVYLSVFSLHL